MKLGVARRWGGWLRYSTVPVLQIANDDEGDDVQDWEGCYGVDGVDRACSLTALEPKVDDQRRKQPQKEPASLSQLLSSQLLCLLALPRSHALTPASANLRYYPFSQKFAPAPGATKSWHHPPASCAQHLSLHPCMLINLSMASHQSDTQALAYPCRLS